MNLHSPLSRITRSLISSHISAQNQPAWDRLETWIMEPEAQRKRAPRHRHRPATNAGSGETSATNLEARATREPRYRRNPATEEIHSLRGPAVLDPEMQGRRDPRNRRPAAAIAGNGETSGYKSSHQTREKIRNESRDAWSLWKDPNVRVGADSTRIHQARDRVKSHVENVVKSVFGRKYRVEYFGSIRYGVSHSHSDLDMIVIDPDNPQGYAKTQLSDPIYKPRLLATAMRRNGFLDVEYRSNSSVPIVKFKDRFTGLDCDLNVNERLGAINSDMIKTYSRISRVLEPMLFSIKEWAKPLNLNSASGGIGVPASFSSYALAIMTIVFLQEQSILPNLQEGLPPLSPSENETLVWTLKPHQGWDARFRKDYDLSALPSQPDANIQTLLRSWYQFWETFPYETKCASVRHGDFLDRNSPLLIEYKERRPPSPVCVIDPFIRTKNVTAAVPKKVLDRFKIECGKAAARIA